MAEKRMFSKAITDRDVFLEMPTSAQCLYFHFGMHADDDGFVDSPRRIMNSVGARDDDMKLLLAKRFLIPFENGVCVITHWRLHNYLRTDRYKPTAYTAEKARLSTLPNGEYTTDCVLGIPSVNQMSTVGIPNGNQMATVGIPLVCIDKSSIDKSSSSRDSGGCFLSETEMDTLADGIHSVLDAAKRAGFPDTQADWDKCNTLVADYGAEAMLAAISTCAEYPMDKRNWRYLRGILKSDPTGGTQEREPKWETPMQREFEG